MTLRPGVGLIQEPWCAFAPRLWYQFVPVSLLWLLSVCLLPMLHAFEVMGSGPEGMTLPGGGGQWTRRLWTPEFDSYTPNDELGVPSVVGLRTLMPTRPSFGACCPFSTLLSSKQQGVVMALFFALTSARGDGLGVVVMRGSGFRPTSTGEASRSYLLGLMCRACRGPRKVFDVR